MRTHELKTWPEPFQAIVDGRKQFEIREDDRGFAVGDLLVLREYEPGQMRFTGRRYKARVTYLAPGGKWGIPERLCVMSIVPASMSATPSAKEADHECA